MRAFQGPSEVARFLIVNADDFGLSEGVNRGIAQAHEGGIVTSASLMVRPPAAQAAADYARAHPELSVGLHFDAAEWRYERGEWIAAYNVIDLDHAREVRCELARQLEEFERLLGATPTHLDSHQHVHRREPALSILREVAMQLSIPLRGFADSIRYCGDFYGQTREGEAYVEGISSATLGRLVTNLRPGWTELGCHPGRAEKLASIYAAEREEEVRTLCDPQISEAVAREAVALCSFRGLRASADGGGAKLADTGIGRSSERWKRLHMPLGVPQAKLRLSFRVNASYSRPIGISSVLFVAW